jgi:hypothetical protein
MMGQCSTIGVIAKAKSPKLMVPTRIPKLTAYLNAHLDQTEPGAPSLREMNSFQQHNHAALIYPMKNCWSPQDLSCSSLSILLTSEKMNAE